MSTSPEGERLQKVLAAAGVASRRACEELIAAGRVTVDGVVAHLGQRVDPTSADVRVDGERVNVDPQRVYAMLNKPRGYVTTASDPEGRPTVFDLVDAGVRLFSVGRLDRETEGLLLLTNDGELAHALQHPSFEVERTYLAQIAGTPRREHLRALRDGVELEDGPARARRVRVLSEAHGRTLLELVLTEGRKHEVRRLLDAVGFPVQRLARTAFDGVELGDLRQGRWRPLDQAEIGRLYAAVQAGPRPPPKPRRPARGADVATKRRSEKSTKRSSDQPTRRARP
jgi:23S rRNA pseudouridine2605 synthase